MAIDREELKKLGLEEDTITKVLNLHHAELKPFKEKAEQYDNEKERADKLKADYDAQTKKITDLEKLSGNATGLQAEIEKLKEEAKKKEEEHRNTKAKADGKGNKGSKTKGSLWS